MVLCMNRESENGLYCLQEMTYVKQLEDYEEAVMKKRLEEMPQAEKERLLAEIEQRRRARRSKASPSWRGGLQGVLDWPEEWC